MISIQTVNKYLTDKGDDNETNEHDISLTASGLHSLLKLHAFDRAVDFPHQKYVENSNDSALSWVRNLI